MPTATKPMYGPPTKGTALLLSCDGSRSLTEKSRVLGRWAEHFSNILSRPSTMSDAAIDRLPQAETYADLDLLSFLPKNTLVVEQLSSREVYGSDAIPAEIHKHGGHRQMDQLTELFQETWRCGQVPQDFKDVTIIHLYERKGNRPRRIVENHAEVRLSRAIHACGTSALRRGDARVTDNGEISEAFAWTNGVRHGCVFAPSLFIFMLSAMLVDAYRDVGRGNRADSRTDGHLLNSRRIPAPTRLSTTFIHDLLFADHCAPNGTIEEDI
ncbi:hypothetical protein SprV_0301097500 [Sparganum proliferum]